MNRWKEDFRKLRQFQEKLHYHQLRVSAKPSLSPKIVYHRVNFDLCEPLL
jgi:hypothetical protein